MKNTTNETIATVPAEQGMKYLKAVSEGVEWNARLQQLFTNESIGLCTSEEAERALKYYSPAPMDEWDKDQFTYCSGHLVYGLQHSTSRFVARFKYSAQKKDKPRFLRFLIKNFTPQEYFDKLAQDDMTPLGALREKGYEPRSL